MKKLFRLLISAVLTTAFMSHSFVLETAVAAIQDQSAKKALYEKFVKERSVTDPASQKAAYETGKEYLSKYGAPVDEFNTYVRGWIGKYEKASRLYEFEQAVNAKDIDKAFQLGQQILAADPNDVHVYFRLTQAGFTNAVELKNKSKHPETINAARTALKLLDQGKEPVKWTTFKDRDDALGGLNYVIGYLTLENSPEQAVEYFIKAAQSNSKFKTEATTYTYLGIAYYKGPVTKLATEYKAKYEGRAETPESIALYAKVNQGLDYTIDAYARAVALMKDPVKKKDSMDLLTAVYKSRHQNSDAGLSEYIAGALNRPLPVPTGF